VLADVALESPSIEKQPLWLALNDAGEWKLVDPEEAADFINLNTNGLATQVWQGDQIQPRAGRQASGFTAGIPEIRRNKLGPSRRDYGCFD
jgi:hypothetical protein